jgi:hypothetical protein
MGNMKSTKQTPQNTFPKGMRIEKGDPLDKGINDYGATLLDPNFAPRLKMQLEEEGAMTDPDEIGALCDVLLEEAETSKSISPEIGDWTIDGTVLSDQNLTIRCIERANQEGARVRVVYKLPDPENLTEEDKNIIRTLKLIAERDDVDFEVTPFEDQNEEVGEEEVEGKDEKIEEQIPKVETPMMEEETSNEIVE